MKEWDGAGIPLSDSADITLPDTFMFVNTPTST
jgi:hypothetical protein